MKSSQDFDLNLFANDVIVILPRPTSILLADDDADDCFLFEDALKQISISTHLTITHDGVDLMQILLASTDDWPDVLFLDLNMPLKNGFQCLSEIKRSEKLKHLDVNVLSTALDQDLALLLFRTGAKHCIRKPNDFRLLKKIIQQVLAPPDAEVVEANSESEKIKKFILSRNVK